MHGAVAGGLLALAALGAGCTLGLGQGAGSPAQAASAVPQALASGTAVELAPAVAASAPAPAALPDRVAARDAKPNKPYSRGYSARIARVVRANIVFSATSFPRLKRPCEVDVSTATDGRIVSFSVTNSSGSRDWDEAVKRGLIRTHTLPLDVDGRIPANMILRLLPR